MPGPDEMGWGGGEWGKKIWRGVWGGERVFG